MCINNFDFGTKLYGVQNACCVWVWTGTFVVCENENCAETLYNLLSQTDVLLPDPALYLCTDGLSFKIGCKHATQRDKCSAPFVQKAMHSSVSFCDGHIVEQLMWSTSKITFCSWQFEIQSVRSSASHIAMVRGVCGYSHPRWHTLTTTVCFTGNPHLPTTVQKKQCQLDNPYSMHCILVCQ